MITSAQCVSCSDICDENDVRNIEVLRCERCQKELDEEDVAIDRALDGVKHLPLSPRVKFARIVLIIGLAVGVIVIALMMHTLPDDETLQATPSGMYQN